MGVISLDLQQTDAGANRWSYNWLTDLPSINGVTIQGDLTLEDLDIIIPTKVSELENDAGYITEEDLTGRFYTKDEVYNKEETYNKGEVDSILEDYYTSDEVDTKIGDEATARADADSALSNRIDTNATNINSLAGDIAANSRAISDEATARQDADTALSGRIDTNATNIATNTTNIATNTTNIATNTADIATNTANIATNTADIATNASNIATNTANIATNATNIAANTSAIATNTANIATNTANIATNTTNIATNTADIATNTANIATNASAIAQNASDIATNAANIATNTANIATNAAGIATNASDIAGETDAREIADQGLQEQIDALAASSDVVDIVGTYAALQAYDTSKLHDNDIIKVLDDETRNDATTYYRWAVSTSTWSYIGAEGPFYTKADADATFVPQTRTINSKALSSNVTLTAQDVGALPDSTVIPTVNNATLTIQKNGSTVQTFTANSSTNKTANITVPTKTSDLTNDGDGSSNFATETYVDTYGGKIDVIKVNGTAQTITNKTVDITVPTKTSEITNDSDFVTSTGTVAKANKLSSAKTIGIGTGGTGTATAFDGSSNITIPLTDVKDSYVTWGGKPIYSSVSPDDAGCIDEFGHNKMAFLPANCIQVHYSTDGGSTWTDYGLTDAQKIQLVTYGDVYCRTGGETAATSSNVTKLKLRIRIATAASTTTTGVGSLYTDWRKVLLNVNDPNSNCNMTMRYRTIANYKSGTETWVNSDTTYPVRGGTAWNSIPRPSGWPAFGGNYANQTSQIGQLEFILSNTKLGTWGDRRGSICSIRMIGMSNWAAPSEMARTGRLYTIDAASKNATFPASIYAGSDISAYNIYFRGGSNYGHIGSSNTPFKDICLSDGIYKGSYKLTLPNKTGTVALTSDIPGVFTGAGASTAGTSGLVPAPAAGDNTKFLSGDGTWKTVSQYELPIASANTLGGVKIGENLSITSTGILSADAQHIDVDSAMSTTSENPVQNKVITTELNKKANSSSLATVATSGSYNDLSNKPTIPTVNNATLTIQKNGTTVQTFTANSSSNKTANITVPTKTSDLTNDSNFVASGDLATVATSGSYNDLSNKPTIPAAQVQSNWTQTTTTAVDYIKNKPTLATVATSGSYNDLSNKPTIPTVNNATLTIQKNGSTVKTFTANASSNVTANITVPTATSELTNDAGFIDEIPVASAGTLGGIKVGDNLSIDTNGVLSADAESITVDSALSTSSPNPVQNSVITAALNGKANSADLSAVATSGSYNDLSNKPTIPTVNNGTLTIQKNGTTVQTFTANQSSNATANITVDYVKTADNLTPTADTPAAWKKALNSKNGAFLTWYSTANKFTNQPSAYGFLETFLQSSDIYQRWHTQSSGPILYRSGNASGWSNPSTGAWNTAATTANIGNGTLTIQKNGTNVQTFTANQSGDATANIQVPNLQTSDTDPGEGSALAADTFLGIYDIAPEDVDGSRLINNTVTRAKIDSAFIDELFYKPGDTITAAVSSNYDGAQIMYNGFLTSGNKNCVITIPVQKRLDNITSATINYLYGYARCHGGYLTNINNNQNIVAQSTSVVTTIHPETNSITVCFTCSSGWGATNNAAVSLAATSVSITLS